MRKRFGAGNPRMDLHDDGFAVTRRATDQGHHAPRQHFHAVEVPRGDRSVEPSPDLVRCRHRVASRPEAGPVRPEAAQLAVESVSAVCRRARVQDHAVMLALSSSSTAPIGTGFLRLAARPKGGCGSDPGGSRSSAGVALWLGLGWRSP